MLHQLDRYTAAPAPVRRLLVTVDDTGAETIENLDADALVFRDVAHMINSIVRGDLGEKVTQRLASTACLSMVGAADTKLKALRRDEVQDVLDNVKRLSPDELHELTTEAYRELCVRSTRLAYD